MKLLCPFCGCGCKLVEPEMHVFHFLQAGVFVRVEEVEKRLSSRLPSSAPVLVGPLVRNPQVLRPCKAHLRFWSVTSAGPCPDMRPPF